MFLRKRVFALLAVFLASEALAGAALPKRYFELMEAGVAAVSSRLAAEPNLTLGELEARPGWRHFGYAILAPAVLYTKDHADNARYQDPEMLALAIRLGDLFAQEDEAGTFEPRLDSDWDTYMWLETYRLLESQLGEARRERWKKALVRNVQLVWSDAYERVDFPWYNTPYIGTSPNHYAQYAGNLLLAGRLFGIQEWEELGTTILHRFSAVEQTADGYWGEHSRRGPTTGYNHLTLTSVALYWEMTRDPAALEAMRRSTDFHKYFTYPNGEPVEVINDRNRHWGVSAWAHFAFSHFDDGRGYAEFLTDFFDPESLTIDQLGRLSQNALYYHEGPVTPAPQRQLRFVRRMEIPAAIRKEGPWVVCLSGIVDTSAPNNRFYLDRQGNLSLFHERTGMIVTGANSKRQPEIATFTETLNGEVVNLPLSSRLQMGDSRDRLSVAYNSFFADIWVTRPDSEGVSIHIVTTGRGSAAGSPQLNLQLVLRAGEVLETGTGQRIVLGSEPLDLDAAALGGLIRHHGWEMRVDPTARLSWPFYPQNPYADSPETSLEQAVGRLTIPLRFTTGRYIRPAEQEIDFRITILE
jgi:hypothetical protein